MVIPPSSAWVTAAWGLLAAGAMGAADFAGGVAARRISFAMVIAASHAVGFVLLVVLAFATRSAAPTPEEILWSTAAGFAAVGGLAALYRALAVGRMGVAAPVSGVVAAALPVGLTALSHGLPPIKSLVGFALGMASIWLIAQSRSEPGGRRGLRWALLAGVAFGFFFVFMDHVKTPSFLWPLSVARAASCLAAMGLAFARGRPSLALGRALWALLVASAVLDVSGNACFLVAAHSGRLDVASVVTSLYPVSTIVLARVVLGERLAPLQVSGIVTAMTAVMLIASG